MEEQYYYHVISDVPKHVGEHLILNEDHPNRVYKRIQEHMDTIEDIANHPENYKDDELSYPLQVGHSSPKSPKPVQFSVK